MRWDIFCSVVDNLGDIGVCWRLARQLAAQHAGDVRVWVDDLASFRQLAPMLDAGAAVQRLGEIEVRAWKTPFEPIEPADIVVETFGCELPDAYVGAMAGRARAPVWINLEYLSAETWVDGCHGLPSPHPRWPLVRYFFFPGFSARTGGVPIERGLARHRQAFQQDQAAMRQFLESRGVRAPAQGEILLSLFCYPQAPLKSLLEACAAGPRPVRVISFDGTPGAQALRAFDLDAGRRQGALAGDILPFLTQDDYDRVLWACDWNAVRGEDSFVRAQLAARPLLWQAYPQKGDAHAIKVQAFLDRYRLFGDAGASTDLREVLDPLWKSWNSLAPARNLPQAWAACQGQHQQLERLARQWPAHLEALGDLATNLAQFCAERV